MLANIKFNNVKKFKILIDVLEEIYHESNIIIKNSKKMGKIVFIQSMNSHQSLIIYIKLTNFESFELIEDINFWIDIGEINKFVKDISNEDMLNLTIDDKSSIKFETNNVTKSRKSLYEQKTLGVTPSIKSSLDIKNDFDVEINSDDFKKICTKMSKFSEYMNILCDKNKILFKCQSKAGGQLQEIIENGVDGVIINVINENAKNINMNYLLEDLVIITKCSKLGDKIILYLKNDNPLIMKLNSKNFGEIIVYLSAREKSAN